MTRASALASLLALPLLLAAPARAQNPDHCIFTSPASHVCPADRPAPVRVAAVKTAPDHCVFTSPGAHACPAPHEAGVSVASIKAPLHN